MKSTVKEVITRIVIMTSFIFMLFIVYHSFLCYMENDTITPHQILIVWCMAFAVSTLTAFRKIIERKQWMLRISYPVKRLLFAPLYLSIALITLLNLDIAEENIAKTLIIACVSFAITFILVGFFAYIIRQRKIKNYNVALEKYKEKIKENES